jgi:type I restriction-modification system DNA methylase subunit
MNTPYLHTLIKNFNNDNLESFLREKSDNIEFPKEELYVNNEKFTNYDNAVLLAKSDLPDGILVVCTLQVTKDLTERSSKKEQYELAKNILKSSNSDAGIFVFYDNNSNFRFSLVYAEYQGNKRTWNNFKRFTYFVSPHQTNKTFLDQIGKADFSTIELLKEAFSVEPVTKQFYNEIQSWYFWAMDKIKFPTDYKYSDNPEKDDEIRNSNNLIRLITRVIFIWFIKQKNLINDELFSEDKLKNILKDFNKNNESANYYNAILQNLFFATLNQKMNERKFAENNGFQENKKEYGVKNLYRYDDLFQISKEEILQLFNMTPFLNGGLFDCLDKENENGKVIYIDGFSRNPQKKAIIPDFLFFQKNETKVNLSKYGLSKDSPIKGLIKILQEYNFTIDENTPIDQEVALDPELLGKVFENLLASYNPETATTARKATGSYYTPREIVDYMVQESLFNYLIDKYPNIDQSKLKELLSYSENSIDLTEKERDDIIAALDNIKILDPACGSGAFPMGALHKIVYALQKLDPDNSRWKNLQIDKVNKETNVIFHQTDKNEREARLKELNEMFDESINYPDYARKLFIIENCIYGVDIQTIAIQISKLRFFISLVLDQKVDNTKENMGIRALPNMETKFVAANTLIGLYDTKARSDVIYYNQKVIEIRDKLNQLRHKYFSAKTRKDKLDYQRQDRELRKEMSEELYKNSRDSKITDKIANFDIYDPNASADWFDPEWMFGVEDGFDIVIGNPPYIQLQKAFDKTKKYADLYINQNYKTFDRAVDIYCLFYEKGINLLCDGGHLAFITSNKWMRAGYGEKIRQFFNDYNPKILIDLGPGVFENATVDTNILIIQKTKNQHRLHAVTINEKKKDNIDFSTMLEKNSVILQNLSGDAWFIGSDAEQKLKEKIEHLGKPLKDWDVKIYRGITTGLNEAFIIDDIKRQEILDNCKDEDERRRTEAIIKPILRGRDIKRYYYEWAGLWVIIAKFGFYKESHLYPSIVQHLTKYEEQLKNRGQCKYNRQNKVNINKDYTGQHHWLELDNNPNENYLKEFEKEKVVWQELAQGAQFAFDSKGEFFVSNTAYILTGKKLKYILGYLNSRLNEFTFEKWYCTKLGGKGIRWLNQHVTEIPIPMIDSSNQHIVSQIESLVDKILAAKKTNHAADTTAWEKEIDQLVYKLYELTDEEIAIIENGSI